MTRRVTDFFSKITEWLGSFLAITLAALLIILWLLFGPFFHFNDTYQLVINTSTTIITFLMVFIIQNTQNRDGRAVETKLDAILRILDPNLENPEIRSLLGIEDLPEPEIKEHQERVRKQKPKPRTANKKQNT